MQPEGVMEQPGWRAVPEKKEEESTRMQQHWEAQWQEFLKTLQVPHLAWGSLQLSEAAHWDDAKAFLASFEQVAEACRWPREEWVARLLPALSGETQQAFSLLAARDKEDYGKVKAAILRGNAQRRERQRQHFRQFCCQELGDPRRMYSQLQELCCQWLKPEKHTKEQILELLILEQFLVSLPEAVQSRIRAGGLDSGAQVVALVEDFLVGQQEAESEKSQFQGPLQGGHMEAVEVKAEPLDPNHGEIYNEVRQNGDVKTSMPGSEIHCPGHSSSSLLPEEQGMAEDALIKESMNLGETNATLHIVEQTPAQPGQQTMFWKILQEEHGDVAFMDDGAGAQLKADNFQCRGNEPAGTPKTEPQTGQENMLSNVEMDKETCDAKGPEFRMDSLQYRGGEIQEILKTLSRVTQKNASAEEQISRSKGQQMISVTEQKEFLTFSEIPSDAQSKTTMHTGPKIPLASRYGRLYHYKASKFDMSCAEDNPSESCRWGKNQTINTREKLGIKSIQQINDLSKHQSSRIGEKTWECPECGKFLISRPKLLAHQQIHLGRRPHKCSHCGRVFSRKLTMQRHQRLHMGERPYECLECGKDFSRKDALFCHQRRHKRRQSLYRTVSDNRRLSCPQCPLGCPLHTTTK